MRKVLIVTYYWPPGSGAGVQRWLKFSKYLPALGWEPVILTVDPHFAAYPAIDKSLENEIPEKLSVFKTKATDYFRLYTKDKSKVPSSGFASDGQKGFLNKLSRFVRGNFFIPDPRKGWNMYAFRKACSIIEEQNIENIITTSPPHSTQLVGLKLKKKYPSINWIADLRDPWTDIYYYKEFYPTLPAKALDASYEKKVLSSADKIITVGKSLKEIFSSKIHGIASKIEVISNGYDSLDFEGLKVESPEIFTISYIGTLSDKYNVTGLGKALGRLTSAATDFRVRFAGLISENQADFIRSITGESKAEFIPYVRHSTAVKLMLESSVLLLIIPDHQSSKSIITGKLFEYLASGKPIICIGPTDGDAAAILDETGHGKTFYYNDSEGIYSFLKVLIADPAIKEKVSPELFRRDNLVRKVIALLK